MITFHLTKPSAALAWATTNDMWSFQVTLELMVTPRYLVLSAFGMDVGCSLNVWLARLVVFLVKVTCSLENWQTLIFRRESADIRMYSRIMSGKASIDPQRFTLNQCEHNTRMGGIRDTVNTDVKRFSYQHRIHKILNRI